MATSTQETVAKLRAILRDRSDVHLALLFGSTARNQARPDSDVDVAVLAPGLDLLLLGARLTEATARQVDIVSLDDVTVPLLEELVKDAVVLHEGRPGSAARWRFHALVELETDGPWYRRMRDAFITRLAASRDASSASLEADGNGQQESPRRKAL